MPSSLTLVAAGLTVAYGVLALMLFRHSQDQHAHRYRRWLLFALVAALAGAAVTLLPDDAHADTQYEQFFVGELTQPGLGIIIANLMLVCFGAAILGYLDSRLIPLWAVAGLAWWTVQTGASLTTEGLSIGQPDWYRGIYDPVEWPNVLAAGGWIVIVVVLMLVALYAFYRARLSEIANQALFGLVLIPLVVAGVVMSASGEDVLAEMGWIAQFAGLIGAVYGMTTYRVFDIRRAARNATATSVLIMLLALVSFGALTAASQIDAETNNLYVILGGLALALAIVFQPLRVLVETGTARIVGGTPSGSAQTLRQFSEDITGAVELEDVVDVAMNTLRELLRVRRGGLVLVAANDSDMLQIEPLAHGLGEIPDIKGQIAPDSAIIRRLFDDRRALLQYDLDFSPAFAGTPAKVSRFFKQLRMSAYAPVVVHGDPIGILCSGAKVSDVPFTDHDLELLSTVANQAGVALRNARLVRDLRRREQEQGALNRALSEAKERSEKLDSVKTDFITIASHELRTPLAQIRGYTDIMEAMNEQGLLDQDQIEGMTSNLRKAADRLENLIGAMLDVSQLDVNAMDLRFAQTSVENVMRMAIEPLTEAIKARRLMLSARGLRNLSPIEADMQRLVQAFRNVVLNAIKFTPDGGRIDITGQMQDGKILIMIQDSGIGIDPANHDLIFEKFFRAHDPSLHSTGATKFMGAGPGLGLTIARGVVNAHGGRIWVESEGYDQETLPGSTFFIELPVVPPADARRIAPFDSIVSLDSAGAAISDARPVVVPDSSSPAEQTLPRPPEGLRSSTAR